LLTTPAITFACDVFEFIWGSSWVFGDSSSTKLKVLLLPYYLVYLLLHYSRATMAHIFTVKFMQYVCYYIVATAFLNILGLFLTGDELRNGLLFKPAKQAQTFDMEVVAKGKKLKQM